jgi:hypothetical protein
MKVGDDDKLMMEGLLMSLFCCRWVSEIDDDGTAQRCVLVLVDMTLFHFLKRLFFDKRFTCVYELSRTFVKKSEYRLLNNWFLFTYWKMRSGKSLVSFTPSYKLESKLKNANHLNFGYHKDTRCRSLEDDGSSC